MALQAAATPSNQALTLAEVKVIEPASVLT